MSPPTDSPLVPLRRRPTAAAPEAAAATGPRIYIETYGCQMNVADTDLIRGLLGDAGYRPATDPATADVILINTCAVRERAADRVFARARELAAHKRRRRHVTLGIIGCLAEHLKEGITERAPDVDLVVGPDSYRRLPALLADAGDATDPLIDVRLDRRETYEGLSGASGGDGVSGFVTIQRGCDKMCTFCVVPLVRGRERGVPPREVLRQVRAFADAGYREVVLLGQTVNSYRYDDVSFADLLRAVARVPGIERVRFTSPYPVDFTDDVIAAIAQEPTVCKHVHLPVQSGSDRILASMRRNYTVATFRRIVDALRAAIPDIAITTDILTGYCGETDADHADTLALMREVRFDSAFMFLYSERAGTYAARRLADDVPLEVKKARLQQIIALQEQISTERFAARIGRIERVLIHGRSKRRPDQLVGRTDGFKAVILPADAGRPGDFVDVLIERATMATLFGRVVPARA
ncbi:MAG: tRNA (N6-isopentenyl adenosine(37)-C2)-methylthiotransferase MiaB [Deltaproteobacteria bacterium]|nr:MAG: tRNA (N6-isopentenyl adenosine(37)-C2)-methylthiotransferase MiaB [Deltaproteobacteria bacterium]